MDTYRPGKRKVAILAGYMMLIFMTSLIPMDREIKGLQFLIRLKPTIQNFLHIPAFVILSILWLQVVGNHMNRQKQILYVLFLTIGFGILTELIQIAMPGRHLCIMDIALNTIGSILGIMLYYKLETKDETRLTGLT